MKKKTKTMIISVVAFIFFAGFTNIVYAETKVDLSHNLLLKFEDAVNTSKLYENIKFSDEDNNEVPVLLTAISNKEVVAVPVYDMSETKVVLSTTYQNYSVAKYEKQAFLGTKENLKRLSGLPGEYPVAYGIAVKAANPQLAPIESRNMQKEGAAEDFSHSQTNVQVEGIDEEDLVKTDGKYIYYLSEGRINIIETNQGKMNLAAHIKNDDKNFVPQSLYIDQHRLIVIGNSFGQKSENTKCVVYNVKDKKNITIERTIEQEGYYFNSRKKGSKLYIFSSKYLYDIGDSMPKYCDSLKSSEFKEILPNKIMIFPGCVRSSLVFLSSTDLYEAKETEISSFVGEQNELYMSQDHIYLSYQERKYRPFILSPIELNAMAALSKMDIKEKTIIKKFAMDGKQIHYKGEAIIDGWVLNQFSMDEKNGYFRVAYTEDQREYKHGSSLAVFDKDMKRVGIIKNIAPLERIYSVRFMGDRAYMVTFKNIDPFFVLDLKDPKNPKMLGYLKIPGVSHYLHPYDENTVIGFGNDTINNSKNRAFYLGLKISLFDVSDVSNPIEKDVKKIGDRGTTSELTDNHKVLMYDAKRGLLGFPVSVAKVQGPIMNEKYEFPQYGEEVFQGAYLYQVTKNDLRLKGTVTHIKDFKNYNYDYDDRITRMIYIDDVLYTISNNQVMSTNINTMKKISDLSIK